MRKSRLYLVLSGLALVFGVGTGIAESRCGGHAHSCPFTCDDVISCPADIDPTAQYSIEYHTDEVYRMVQTGDHVTMQYHVGRLLEHDAHDPAHHAMMGYAHRGQQNFLDAEQSYLQAIEYAEADNNMLMIVDSHTGLAANYHELGMPIHAREHVELALQLAEERRSKTQNADAYYQLGCAYAVRSAMNKGLQSARDRGSAIANLKFAKEAGFDNWAHMAGDLDLKALHGHGSFDALFPHGYEVD